MAGEGSLFATPITVYSGSATYDFAPFSRGAIFSLSVDYLGSTNYEITYTADFTNPTWTYPPYIAGVEFRFDNILATAASLVNSPAGNWAVSPKGTSLNGGTLGTANCQSDSASSFVCADDNHPLNPTPGADPTVGNKYKWVVDATYTGSLSFNDVQIGALFMSCDPAGSSSCTWTSQAHPLINLPPQSSVPEPADVELLLAVGLPALALLSRYRTRQIARRMSSSATSDTDK